MNSLYQMGKMPDAWRGGKAKNITFCVTEDCNLACKYCYLTGKNNKNKMTLEVAKKAVDYILGDRDFFKENYVVWDFIGGEPLLEMELIDQLCDYIKFKMYALNHPWFDNYMFNFSSNGLLYHTPPVQNFIKKNRSHVSIGISLDGNKLKHDLQRVYPDGSGSYDDVLRNVPLWMEQFPQSTTKATFSHDDIPHLKDSIVSLWKLGIKMVMANVIYEDVWHEGDDAIFEQQLKELADYILENDLWEEYSVRFFEEEKGFPLNEEEWNKNYCGTGKMLAIDYKGTFYPCVRFVDYSLSKRKGYSVGDIYHGINLDKLRPFHNLTLKSQSKKECIECQVAEGCSWCSGYNYDCADTETLFQRTTFICKMHQANCRANDYFWENFTRKTGIIPEQREARKAVKMANAKKLMFITSDAAQSHCCYQNNQPQSKKMDKALIEKGLKFAAEHSFVPIFLGEPDVEVLKPDWVGIAEAKKETRFESVIAVYDNKVEGKSGDQGNNCIVRINKDNVKNIYSIIDQLSPQNGRINLILEDITAWGQAELDCYREQLDLMADLIAQSFDGKGIPIEINVLTDIFNLKKMCNCDAGDKSFALAPDGKIYLCPAFYFDNPEGTNHIGDLENGIQIKNQHLLNLDNSYMCTLCDAYHCKRCLYLNKKFTSEYTTSPKAQCVISHIERTAALKLQEKMADSNVFFSNILTPKEYEDPIELISKKEGVCAV